jgi:hypothetical protein
LVNVGLVFACETAIEVISKPTATNMCSSCPF